MCTYVKYRRKTFRCTLDVPGILNAIYLFYCCCCCCCCWFVLFVLLVKFFGLTFRTILYYNYDPKRHSRVLGNVIVSQKISLQRKSKWRHVVPTELMPVAVMFIFSAILLERCHDTPNYPCNFYKTIGFCVKGAGYYFSMLERCPFTCGFCKPGVRKPVGDCYDVWNTESCKKFRKHDLCNSLRWGKRLESNCRKSCRKCTHNAPTLLSVAEECSKNNSCCWDKSIRINGRCPCK